MICWDRTTTVINDILLSKFSWSTHWFKITAQIPSDWSDEEVHFRWNSNSEAMVRLPLCMCVRMCVRGYVFINKSFRGFSPFLWR